MGITEISLPLKISLPLFTHGILKAAVAKKKV
jgi:hypothetical protein